MKKSILAVIGAAVLVGGGGAWWAMSDGNRADETTIIAGNATNDTIGAGEDPAGTDGIVEMTLGPKDAKVTVVEYASFTCGHCGNFHKDQFKKLKAEFIDTGKIHFVYRDVYFDQVGLWAGMMARCEGPSKFFGVSDLIYKQQDTILSHRDPVKAADALRKVGRIAGLNSDKVNACLEDEDRARDLVAWYRKNAEADNVSGTPTLIINGKKYGNMSYAQLRDVIEEKLAE